MQYEMPSTSAHKEHEHAHHEAKGHAGMDHDMSDPKMARAMEKDMRNRFLVALVLTIPTILYSPLGSDFFGLDLPSGIGKNWIALILSTPVVWWAGWIFIGGAARSLRTASSLPAVTLNSSVAVGNPPHGPLLALRSRSPRALYSRGHYSSNRVLHATM